MKFKRYTEIENHYREKYIKILEEHGFANIPYIAHEKIHGCNFSFWTDGIEVKVASRGNFVDGTFYDCQKVIDRYQKNIMLLKQNYYPTANQIAVYGELYGPGIMKGVYYSERKDFRAFEIRVNEHEIEKPLVAKIWFAKCDIPQVPYIDMYGNVYDAIKANNIFASKVQTMDNENGTGMVKFLEFKEDENNAEGMVIQPLDGPLYTGNGQRVMIKSKNPKFQEKNKPRDKKPSEPNLFIPIVEMYVNENRMDAVLSKFPEPTQKDFGKIIGAMSQDVIKDMIKDDDLPEDWKKHDIYQPAGKAASAVVAKFLKEHLLPRL